MKADVAIVGFGPVGKLLSIWLAQRGHSVVALDRFEDVYALPRAVHFDQETGRLLDRIGIGERVRGICRTRDAASEYRSGDNRLLLRLEAPSHGDDGWPARNFFHQPELERLMVERAAECTSLRFLGGMQAIGIEQHANGVRLRYRPTAGGDEQTLQARYLVGCDGANSLVRSVIGSPIHDLGFRHDWVVVDLVRHRPTPWPEAGRQYCDPRRPMTWIPLSPEQLRIEFMLLPGESAASFAQPQAIWPLLRERGIDAHDADIVRHAIYMFRALWLQRWQHGRVLLAGDAAHLTPPFLGQGLCSGLRDAATLAWKLDLVLSGQAAPALLATYDSERIAHVAALIEAAVNYGRLICITDAERAHERDRALLADGVRTLPAVPTPRLGHGTLMPGDAHAGYVFVQGQVQQAGTIRSLDSLADTDFMLVLRDTSLLPAARRAFEHTPNLRVMAFDGDTLRDRDGTFGTWFDEHECRAALVRPDLYLYGTARDQAGIEALATQLKRMLENTADV